ncbi:hypothetical protein N7533_009614 [Penicillium manginii]|uniref:uncharacterized protein n=1 Tax=Penicillium manginii TaxID=203109 RepID=UPI0025478E71|nr:uncharacterized protein N7533_009614 [Penicillium manginii]KAJ5744744.1 hypothetical protein N7533_009614 [Penicillium manginii]
MDMDRGGQVEPSGGVPQRFSDDLSQSSPAESPNRALVATDTLDRNRERLKSLQDEWDQFLLDGSELGHGSLPDNEALLLDQSRRLHAAWSKFRHNLPKDQQIKLGDHERPDIKFLVAAVKKASATWQSGREESTMGKVKSKFHSLCETCHKHSSLLAIIPKDDKYVSLLTGSLSAIAQATINHRNIAEGVADTLDDLCHNIDFWNRQMMKHGESPTLRQYIQEIYIVVFEFFTEIFNKWSKSGWKRLITSFDGSAFDQLFTSKRNLIMKIERRMERDIELDDDHRKNLRMDRIEAILSHLPLQMEEKQKLLFGDFQRFLEQQSFRLEVPQPASNTSMIEGTGKATSSNPTSDSKPSPPEPEANLAQRAHYRYSRTEIQAELTIFTSQWMNQVDYLIQAVNESSVLQLNKEVHRRLMTWLRGLNSTHLWIHGPYDVSRPSQNSITTLSLAALARTNNIPCIFYFCTFTGHHESGVSKGVDLGSLLASIVMQLVQFIPDKGFTETDLSPARFGALARGALSVVETLQLIRDVRNVGPSLVYGFLDNVHVLEDRSDEAYTRDFLKTIATLCKLDRGSQLPEHAVTTNDNEAVPGTKICFTTEGYVDSLAQAEELQLVDRVEFDIEIKDPMAVEVGEQVVWDGEGCRDE